MIPTLQRTHSKAKAISNNVVWTGQEPIPVTFTMNGLVSSGLCGLYRVAGRPMYCSAYQLDFVVPGQDPGILITVNLVQSNGTTIPGSLMQVYGCASNAFQSVAPPFLINAGNTMQANISVVNGIQDYLPQDMVLTYYMNFSNSLPFCALQG